MKKLSNTKGKVHPSPVPTLSFLPATILTLAAALSPDDREVLAYLISFCGSTSTSNNSNSNNTKTAGSYKTTHKSTRGGGGGGDGDHAPLFDCNCFRCYKSFWARWDMSPNRQLIHEIIEAYEEGMFREDNKRSVRKKKKRGNKRVCNDDQFENGESGSPELTSSGVGAATAEDLGGGDRGGEDDDEVEEEKGSVAKVVNFLGERIWNFWGRN